LIDVRYPTLYGLKSDIASGPKSANFVAKAKIEPRQKSRESRFLSVSIAEGLFRIETKVRGRFCVKRYAECTTDMSPTSIDNV
jgi:hypothetical protein